MKESQFIEQNKEKWLDFENNLLKKDADPSKVSKLFVQVTDDLSYARTFYPNRSVKLYLNGIAKLLFNDINKSQKTGWAAFLNFWKKDLPLIIFDSRRAMLISLLVFTACFMLGVFASIQDKDFAGSILSSNYVNMTNQNIAKGDPMAVYKSQSELRTFLPILQNNLWVVFLTFFSGIFMAIGSLVVMVSNGVMVGVFQYFFIERGLFWHSFLTIWTHGTLEISAIILSGGAGLTFGKGLLFPGTYTRFQAFKLSGMNGLKIILGVIPIIFLAAFIEGFLTRHTDLPDAIRLLFILVSLGFILAYFFFYPRRVTRQSKKEEHAEKEHYLVYKTATTFDPSEIYTVTKVVTETFRLLFANFFTLGWYLILFSLLSAVLIAYNPFNLFHYYGATDFLLGDFLNFPEYPSLGVFNGLCFGGFTFIVLLFLKKKFTNTSNDPAFEPAYLPRKIFSVILSTGLFILISFVEGTFSGTIAVFLLPLLMFIAGVSNYQNLSFYRSIGFTSKLLKRSLSTFIPSMFILMILYWLITFASHYALKWLFVEQALVWLLTDNEMLAETISFGFIVFQISLSFLLFLTLTLISNSLMFFSFKEAYTAEHLISRIKNISTAK